MGGGVVGAKRDALLTLVADYRDLQSRALHFAKRRRSFGGETGGEKSDIDVNTASKTTTLAEASSKEAGPSSSSADETELAARSSADEGTPWPGGGRGPGNSFLKSPIGKRPSPNKRVVVTSPSGGTTARAAQSSLGTSSHVSQQQSRAPARRTAGRSPFSDARVPVSAFDVSGGGSSSSGAEDGAEAKWDFVRDGLVQNFLQFRQNISRQYIRHWKAWSASKLLLRTQTLQLRRRVSNNRKLRLFRCWHRAKLERQRDRVLEARARRFLVHLVLKHWREVTLVEVHLRARAVFGLRRTALRQWRSIARACADHRRVETAATKFLQRRVLRCFLQQAKLQREFIQRFDATRERMLMRRALKEWRRLLSARLLPLFTQWRMVARERAIVRKVESVDEFREQLQHRDLVDSGTIMGARQRGTGTTAIVGARLQVGEGGEEDFVVEDPGRRSGLRASTDSGAILSRLGLSRMAPSRHPLGAVPPNTAGNNMMHVRGAAPATPSGTAAGRRLLGSTISSGPAPTNRSTSGRGTNGDVGSRPNVERFASRGASTSLHSSLSSDDGTLMDALRKSRIIPDEYRGEREPSAAAAPGPRPGTHASRREPRASVELRASPPPPPSSSSAGGSHRQEGLSSSAGGSHLRRSSNQQQNVGSGAAGLLNLPPHWPRGPRGSGVPGASSGRVPGASSPLSPTFTLPKFSGFNLGWTQNRFSSRRGDPSPADSEDS